MDWPSPNAGLSDSDLSRVFQYVPQETTVVRRLSADPKLLLWSHENAKDWDDWLEQSSPSIQDSSGLVLIFARKGGETKGSIQEILDGAASFGSSRANSEFKSSFSEKNRSYSWPKSSERITTGPATVGRRLSIGARNVQGGSHDVRQLPFEKETFRKICKKFFVHSSISRVISRADVPIFSRAQVKMGPVDSEGRSQPAYVYNCRSANTWKNDLALTVTYFPRRRLVFGILFGCTAAVERQVLNRIASNEEHAFHPLLLSGIFAELERTRMVDIVEKTIDEIEGAIFELDSGTGGGTNAEKMSIEDAEDYHPGGTRYVRRTVWLNTTFLRHRLQIWKTQLSKMIAHVDELSETDFGSDIEPFGEKSGEDEIKQLQTQVEDTSLRRTSIMIKDRLRGLIEEFEDKIEDCTMRVDGMTIATQWSQADINVDIATAAGQDSSQMRSIALVTMVFLPGTFFATLFSMTFFNWNASGDGSIVVSSYLWIYFLVTGVFTVATLLIWWCFLGRRQRWAQSSKSIRRCC
ncbi:uncharacterized protein LY89DRAFT_691534 [Mollisia scopiformis]|uniref:Uncharacterized protein n=1 Tax=Mollisia scopiformis TaxID=149040 RepID=A0A132B612_MOLSC|nr:uncharacterized protein LY89DRAFT_691534 [Mollisia scopiformis]KUJ07848.1 hypothetical protein LY89DRAFT_691534 [Mollisia scopiformis]